MALTLSLAYKEKWSELYQSAIQAQGHSSQRMLDMSLCGQYFIYNQVRVMNTCTDPGYGF